MSRSSRAPVQAFRAEDLGPLIEGQVGGDQDGAPLVALAEDLKEEFRAGGGQGHEALFVDDQQAEAGQLPLQVEQLFLVPGLHQLVDQGGGGGEAHGHSPLAGGQAKPQELATVKGGAIMYRRGGGELLMFREKVRSNWPA